MRILIVAGSHHWDRPGGGAKIALDTAMEVRRRGHEVWVIAHGKAQDPEHRVIDGINLLTYCPEQCAVWSLRRLTMHQEAAKRVLARWLPEVDVIHGFIQLAYLGALDFYKGHPHACYTVCSPATMEMAIVWKKASIQRKLTAPLALRLIRRIERDCLRRSHVTTGMSQYTKDCIEKIHGHKLSSQLAIIPGWVDTTRFMPIVNRTEAKRELGWPTDRAVFFTLRRLEARMGLDRLIDALSTMYRDGFRFHMMIGGSGSMRPQLEEQVRNCGIEEAVSFLGRVDDRILPRAYGACDAFVLPTTELECFGIIALEAMAAGRAVLATPVGAIPEIVRGFEPQWLAASSRADDIRILLSNYLRFCLAVHSSVELHAYVEKVFGVNKVLSEFVDRTTLVNAVVIV